MRDEEVCSAKQSLVCCCVELPGMPESHLTLDKQGLVLWQSRNPTRHHRQLSSSPHHLISLAILCRSIPPRTWTPIGRKLFPIAVQLKYKIGLLFGNHDPSLVIP